MSSLLQSRTCMVIFSCRHSSSAASVVTILPLKACPQRLRTESVKRVSLLDVGVSVFALHAPNAKINNGVTNDNFIGFNNVLIPACQASSFNSDYLIIKYKEGINYMSHFLTPVLALIIWSLIIWCIMYVRRIPAMQKAKIDPDTAKSPDGDWKSKMPANVQYAAHNYNHLMEQPTIFYALMLTIFLMDKISPLALYCAWGYVALRIIHSLVQLTSNKVIVRFMIFSVSTILLIIMALSTAAKLV